MCAETPWKRTCCSAPIRLSRSARTDSFWASIASWLCPPSQRVIWADSARVAVSSDEEGER